MEASKQIIQWEAQGHAPIKSNELHGRVRIAYFQFKGTRDAAALVLAENDVVRLCQLPAGARLIGGTIKFGAFGASVVLDLGLRALDDSGFIDADGSVADDPDAIATNVDVSAAGTASLFEETAYLFYETEKEIELYCTFQGANPSDSAELFGTVLYVVD